MMRATYLAGLTSQQVKVMLLKECTNIRYHEEYVNASSSPAEFREYHRFLAREGSSSELAAFEVAKQQCEADSIEAPHSFLRFILGHRRQLLAIANLAYDAAFALGAESAELSATSAELEIRQADVDFIEQMLMDDMATATLWYPGKYIGMLLRLATSHSHSD
jgi:hypothetical protein